MSDPDAPTHQQRCVVYDVKNSYSRDRRQQENRRYRYDKKNNGNQQRQPQNAPCAVELQRAISTITEYGQQAYAMGAIRALNLLTNLAVRLRTIAIAPQPEELQSLAEEAEIAIEEIRSSLGRSRNST